ncbi:MAG: tetratricopeptide repeat protein [Alphaproteobacteria bacterium]
MKAVFTAGVLVFAANSGARAQHTAPEDHKAQTPPASQSKALGAFQDMRSRKTMKARAEVAASLHKQLIEAPNDESAELIASALVKIWRHSGSDTADLLLERATMAFQTQNHELATKLLSALTSVAPDFAEGWNQLATVHFLRQDYASAMHELWHVLALEPKHFKAMEGVAIILRETGRKRAALKMIRRVLKIHPRMKSAIQAETELSREVEGQRI